MAAGSFPGCTSTTSLSGFCPRPRALRAGDLQHRRRRSRSRCAFTHGARERAGRRSATAPRTDLAGAPGRRPGSRPEVGTKARGASNAKAKGELGWTPRHPKWCLGFPGDLLGDRRGGAGATAGARPRRLDTVGEPHAALPPIASNQLTTSKRDLRSPPAAASVGASHPQGEVSSSSAIPADPGAHLELKASRGFWTVDLPPRRALVRVQPALVRRRRQLRVIRRYGCACRRAVRRAPSRAQRA